jgi:hypothetical protein
MSKPKRTCGKDAVRPKHKARAQSAAESNELDKLPLDVQFRLVMANFQFKFVSTGKQQETELSEAAEEYIHYGLALVAIWDPEPNNPGWLLYTTDPTALYQEGNEFAGTTPRELFETLKKYDHDLVEAERKLFEQPELVRDRKVRLYTFKFPFGPINDGLDILERHLKEMGTLPDFAWDRIANMVTCAQRLLAKRPTGGGK